MVTDSEGRTYGGHLFEGSEVFVAEVAFHRLAGQAPLREPDELTGLDMWPVE
jgi:predicted DNA-binding protein with PD1-like motif